ncbi:MAG: SDR family NAD(P)-dependent oxidoreductase [Proteobacteria bacterium]|nr:SDR family NAD(P)-dependent oxidoreductase [Pseudomonadota bacterium]
MLLNGKTAFITGAASGIGREIANLYVRQGANVVIADLNIDAARQAADEIAAAGGQALGVGVDVSDEAQVDALSGNSVLNGIPVEIAPA